jgi:hypothetical protein
MMNSNGGLRRVISDCEDMVTDEADTSRFFDSRLRAREVPESGVSNCMVTEVCQQQSPFPESNQIVHEFVGAYDETISDLTLSSRADPSDRIGAPLTLIESHYGDNDQNLDSSLSGDDSDIISSGDRNQILGMDNNYMLFDNTGDGGTIMYRDERILESIDSPESSIQSSSQRAPSSQTSDWGFFEDVHRSSDGKKGETSRSIKSARISSEVRVHKDNSK